MVRVSAAILVCLVVAAGAAEAQPSSGATPRAGGLMFDGRAKQLVVAIPRIEAAVDVDGTFDEPVWADAATLSGFSRYAPVDGTAAEFATEVLVWSSPTAVYFGIRATAPAGDVRATLADRDRIDSDDRVLIFLSTFNDARQAVVFGVNPLGVQMDGALAEGTRGQGGGFAGLGSGREAPDLSPDYVILNRATGTYERAARQYLRSFRADWLFSYQPTPGTVFFAGYGNSLANPLADPVETRLRRASDGFFLKLSYLFRL